MKFLSILAAVSLALAPLAAGAGSMEKGSDNNRPIAGPVAGEPLDDEKIPYVELTAAGAVLLLVGLVAIMSDSDDSVTTTNNDPE